MYFSKDAVDLVKDSEQLSLKAYRCPAGVLTIGWGHTKDVAPDQEITVEQAEKYLAEDMQESLEVVERIVRVPLQQGQVDALVDFVFNLGSGNLAKSTLLTELNFGNYKGAAEEFKKWSLCNGKRLEGLVKRRAKEEVLFRKGM